MRSSPAAIEGDLTGDPGPLRLVRLRLALALLAMACLPVAVAAPLAATALDGQRSAEHLRIERDSSGVAVALGTRLERIGGAIEKTAAARPILGYASGARDAAAAARTALAALSSDPDGAIRSATLVDPGGHELLQAVGGRIVRTAPTSTLDPAGRAASALDRGEVATGPVAKTGDGTALVVLATPVVATDDVGTHRGVLSVEVSLSRILALAGAAMDSAGSVALLDTHGATLALADVAGLFPAGSSATSERVSAVSELPDGSTWSVRAVTPASFSSPPAWLLGLLGAIVVLLGVLVVGMARQVLRPAEELEASRGRLRDLYELARFDALRDVVTGLGNHRAFQEEIDRLVEGARARRMSISLILIDLDDFRAINDAGGHAAGDEVLAAFGRIVSGALRQSDRAFRTGGDEFALILPGMSADSAEAVGRRILATALDPRVGRTALPAFSFSAGVSAIPALADDRRALEAQADAALAWAKHHGRTTVEPYDPGRHRSTRSAVSVVEQAAALPHVIAGRLLKAVYQPIVDLRNGRVVGYEGLIRPMPDTGFSDPSTLFAAAEASGRSVELDMACLEVAAAGASGLNREAMLTLNLSPRTLEADDFSAGALVGIVRRAGLEPARVVLELTEREQIEEMERLRRNVAACRAAGFRLAADDVGAGNAGLRLLSQVQFDIVKIDLSLVQSGAIHEASLSVVGALQDLARRWGASVIAEGIETPEQLRVVRELDVAAGQGYLLGRPGSAEDLTTIAMSAVDLDALLGRDDWLHRMARGGQGFTAPATIH